MKKIYPKNFIQAVILIIAPILLVSPSFIIKEYFNISESYFFNVFFALYFVCLLLFYKYKNKNNKLRLNFKVNLSIIPVIAFVILFQISINVPFTMLMLYVKTKAPDNVMYFYLSSIVLAPFIEEFVFRGLILNGFLYHYKKSKAILFSTILFTLIHLNFLQFPSALFFGFVSGYIYYFSKSIGYTIISHTVMNTFGLLGVILNKKHGNIPIVEISDVYGEYSLLIISISFSSLILLIIGIFKNKDRLITNLKKLDAPRRLPI